MTNLPKRHKVWTHLVSQTATYLNKLLNIIFSDYRIAFPNQLCIILIQLINHLQRNWINERYSTTLAPIKFSQTYMSLLLKSFIVNLYKFFTCLDCSFNFWRLKDKQLFITRVALIIVITCQIKLTWDILTRSYLGKSRAEEANSYRSSAVCSEVWQHGLHMTDIFYWTDLYWRASMRSGKLNTYNFVLTSHHCTAAKFPWQLKPKIWFVPKASLCGLQILWNFKNTGNDLRYLPLRYRGSYE